MFNLPDKKRALTILVSFFAGLSLILFILDKLFVDTSNDSIVLDAPVDIVKDAYEGRITYINPNFYPEDEITYALTSSRGDRVILLKADDDKLTVVEGLNVKVYGTLSRTLDNKEDVLIVSEVVINNVTD